MTNLNYYGHEIKDILFLSSEILIQLEDNITLETFENLTGRVVSIFESVLINTDAWLELDPV